MANDFNGVFWAKQADFGQNFRTLSYSDQSFESYLRVDDHDEFDELDGLDFFDGFEFFDSSSQRPLAPDVSNSMASTGLLDLNFDDLRVYLTLDRWSHGSV